MPTSGAVTVIATCQLAPVVGDRSGNRTRADAAIRAAVRPHRRPGQLAALPRPEGDRPAEMIKAQAAATTGVFIAVADRCGVERGVRRTGGSTVIGPDGFPLAGPVLADRATTESADVDLHRARDTRIGEHDHLVTDRLPELYA